MKEYTIGEIYRLQLLKNAAGKPYKDKATVSNLLARYPHTKKMTKYGISKLYTQDTVDDINRRFHEVGSVL